MTIAHRRDSFCGKMSACNNLKQYGIPYSLTTSHTERPIPTNSSKTWTGSPPFAASSRALRNLRIGSHWRAAHGVQHGAVQRENS